MGGTHAEIERWRREGDTREVEEGRGDEIEGVGNSKGQSG